MKYFSALIKPASSLCNLRCRYCFYCDVSNNREIFNYGIMEKITAENLIDSVFNYMKSDSTVTFAFQGGEPTLAGLDYFRCFTAYAENINLSNKNFKINYAIQTNGTLIDDEWCKLFKRYNFLVGLSMDGAPEIHNYYRVDSSQNGTHESVLNTAKLFEKHGVQFNILSVVTASMAKHPIQTFNYLRGKGFRYLQFIPCLKPLKHDQITNKHALSPHMYAKFLKTLFNEWYSEYSNGNYISIRMFDNIIDIIRGNPPEQCGMSGYCTPQFVVEADGSVYPCDFYVLDEYNCGNININTIEEIGNSDKMRAFATEPEPLNPLCGNCKYYMFCGGGCKRYREFYCEDNAYCPYMDFLEYAFPKLIN